MIRALHRRLAKLDGGDGAASLQHHREGWWPWCGVSPQQWPESAFAAFTVSFGAHDPEAAKLLEEISGDDLDWWLERDLRKCGVMPPDWDGKVSDIPVRQLTAWIEELRQCPAS